MGAANPLAGRAGYWLRSVSGWQQGKTTWQGDIDALTPIHSVADVRALVDQYNAAGVCFCPVVVPRGADIAGEAAAHAALAREVGLLMVDLECYAGFWDGSSYDLIPSYWAGLRAGAPAAYLVCQPDAREFAWAPNHTEQILPYLDAWCPQHYVGWDSGNVVWLDGGLELQRFDRYAALGRDMFVTLYGVDRVDLAGAFWEAVRDRALGFHTFSLGPMNADQLKFFAGLPRPRPAQPQDPCADLRAALAAAQTENQRLAGIVAAVRAAVA